MKKKCEGLYWGAVIYIIIIRFSNSMHNFSINNVSSVALKKSLPIISHLRRINEKLKNRHSACDSSDFVMFWTAGISILGLCVAAIIGTKEAHNHNRQRDESHPEMFLRIAKSQKVFAAVLLLCMSLDFHLPRMNQLVTDKVTDHGYQEMYGLFLLPKLREKRDRREVVKVNRH